ncbi:MAG: transcriptional regulator [Balneolaceae bacterium]
MDFKALNPLLHSQLRLSIMSFLITNKESDFNELKEITGSTSGNLSVQLKKLEKAGYLTIAKGFKNNYQYTSVKITTEGINAFEGYVEALKSYIKQ